LCLISIFEIPNLLLCEVRCFGNPHAQWKRKVCKWAGRNLHRIF
jgi:hypothetical protein